MKKGSECIAKTINLSQLKACNRPVQVQKLVNADVISPHPDSVKGPYQTPRLVPIRICKRRDMERTLPPKVCACPEKSMLSSAESKIFRWIKNVFKVAITAGLVYWTHAEGVWGEGRETENLYFRMRSTVTPATEGVGDPENRRLPRLENMKHEVLQAYNKSVLGIIGIAVGVPMMLKEKIDILFHTADEADDSPSIAKKDDKQVKTARK